jgi:hypothetical protein
LEETSIEIEGGDNDEDEEEYPEGGEGPHWQGSVRAHHQGNNQDGKDAHEEGDTRPLLRNLKKVPHRGEVVPIDGEGG